jgi:hypothetical protein
MESGKERGEKEKKKRVKIAKEFRHPLDLGIVCSTSSGALHLSLHYSRVDLNTPVLSLTVR